MARAGVRGRRQSITAVRADALAGRDVVVAVLCAMRALEHAAQANDTRGKPLAHPSGSARCCRAVHRREGTGGIERRGHRGARRVHVRRVLLERQEYERVFRRTASRQASRHSRQSGDVNAGCRGIVRAVQQQLALLYARCHSSNVDSVVWAEARLQAGRDVYLREHVEATCVDRCDMIARFLDHGGEHRSTKAAAPSADRALILIAIMDGLRYLGRS